MRNKFLIILFSFLVLFISSCLFTGKPDVFVRETSPDGKFTLLIKNHGAWIFSSHTLSVHQERKFFNKDLFNYELANDGKGLNDDNCKILWKNQKCYIIFSGEEQNDEVFKIDYSGKIIYEQLLDTYDDNYDFKYSIIMKEIY